MKDLLLPSTDGGVWIQVAATIVVAPALLVVVSKKQRDVAWLTAGLVALWVAFMGFRALH